MRYSALLAFYAVMAFYAKHGKTPAEWRLGQSLNWPCGGSCDIICALKNPIRYVMVYQTREEMLKVLGENLKASRLAENLSQQVVAERSGISLKAVRNLESGENASTLSLLSYCRTIRKIDWLMTLAPPEVNSSLFGRQGSEAKRQRAGRQKREA